MKDDNILLEALKEIIKEVEDQRPYKVPGRPETYDNYNQGWADACDILGNKILAKYNLSPSDESNPPDAIAELNKFGEFKITLLDHEK